MSHSPSPARAALRIFVWHPLDALGEAALQEAAAVGRYADSVALDLALVLPDASDEALAAAQAALAASAARVIGDEPRLDVRIHVVSGPVAPELDRLLTTLEPDLVIAGERRFVASSHRSEAVQVLDRTTKPPVLFTHEPFGAAGRVMH